VFATPTGIIVSIGSDDELSDSKTYIKAIRSRETDLHKISAVNNLSRDYASGKLSLEEAYNKIREIENLGAYHFPIKLLGAAFTSGFFCLTFQGTAIDGILAAFTGIIAYLLSMFLGRYKMSFAISDFLCSGLATLIALIFTTLKLTPTPDYIIIGTLLLFVPGAALTNGVRDLLSGDMLSGMSRITEALIIALSLATGVGLVLALWHSFGGV
jgi:uncharacterized membrane protein YjjP (DUF1212 family)